MHAVPHGPLSLIVDFTSISDATLLPLFHTCINLKELVEELQTRKQPYKRRLFYNLKFKYFSINMIQFSLAQGGKLQDTFIDKIYENGNREIIDFIIGLGNKPTTSNFNHAA
jgi:hypothetical protein